MVANLNSFATTRDGAWVRDEHGEPLHVAVDDYFTERPQRVSWAGIDIVNYHRPFEAYMKAFLSSGLRLLDFEEPVPTPDAPPSRCTWTWSKPTTVARWGIGVPWRGRARKPPAGWSSPTT